MLTCASLVVLGCAMLPTSSHAYDEQAIAEVAGPRDGATRVVPSLAAYGGRVVWSTYDMADDAWRLMEATDGSVRRVPIAPRRTPFDVDLGPAADGSHVAVYSRCGTSDGGCDIYAYSFARHRERRLGISTGADETWPAVWGSRVAFVRMGNGSRSLPTPMWGLLRGDRAARRLPTPVPQRRRGERVEAAQLDMRGTSVVYRWTIRRRQSARSFIRFASTDGQGSWVGSGAAGPDQAVAEPELTAAGVQWRLELARGQTTSSYLVRQAITPQRCAGPTLQSSDAVSAVASAQDGNTTYVIGAPPNPPTSAEPGTSATLSLKAITGVMFGGLTASWRRVAPPSTAHELSRPAARSATARCLFSVHE